MALGRAGLRSGPRKLKIVRCPLSAQSLRAEPINAGTLARCLLVFPFMTVRVVVQIYWQALRLLLKKAPFQPHPATKP